MRNEQPNPDCGINYTTTFGTKYVLDSSWNGPINHAVYIKLYTGP